MFENIYLRLDQVYFVKLGQLAISPENMVSGFAAAGTLPFNPNVIPLLACISSPILSQSVGTQNGDQSSTGCVFVMKNTPETTKLIEMLQIVFKA